MKRKFALVSAQFYPAIARWLEDGARQGLAECGVAPEEIAIYAVPGCFEIPLAAQKIISAELADAIVALGAVVRGETAHFDYVAGEAARGIMDVQLRTGVPIGFGVLTTDTMAQAEERADPQRGNKGYHAALAAAAMLDVAGARVPAR